ncbi:SMI1/KNR4 family protein [Paenibacillus sp. EZ-K15]|uniref:SMI1/KNR4 family protein n=1 Tax=Paenibacillus sp. EZ-K15 TaxID=2044275 RepID=UPI000BF409DE|nr:SMI1/KNR4 family protein [Paenibacillus sp. EZ-K15]
MYGEQVLRVREKLKQAAAADPNCQVFGARMHQYRLNEPLSQAELVQFEQQHGVKLPDAYRVFLTEIGNGGAGPYYGIHPLGKKQVIGLERIHGPSVLRAREDQAAGKMTKLCLDNDIDDEAYDEAMAEWCQGLLNIGEQGCGYETMLIVTGEYRGKVVYLDLDQYQSFFTYEEHFLDWYERWLDETIAGYESAWFGLRRGGDDQALMKLYHTVRDEYTRYEALEGMLKLPSIAPETADFLVDQYERGPGNIPNLALQVLAKMDFDRADPLIRRTLHSQDPAARLLGMQLIKWYMPQGERRFMDELLALLPQELNEEAFRLCSQLLYEAGVEPLPLLIPFFRHPNLEFRIQAVYLAGKSADKANYVSEFMRALEDEEVRVQHAALQALREVTDPGLLEIYERMLRQHKTNKDYIRSNIKVRLEEFAFASLEEIEREIPADWTHVRGMLKKIAGL